ncbi:MAG: oxidoreductase [Candidatus Obscuribacterales bacterium]|nr:oxidoreductase [Candidatus Obscuribacterales bacterium]
METFSGQPLNVALIGYGYAGKTFHAPLIASIPGLNLTTFVSSDSAKVLADFPQATVCADPNDVFRNESIDLVVIATPNDLHFDLAKRALDAGKNVVVDKPFTTTTQEAEILVAHPANQDLVLSVFHNRRWDADFLTLKSLLADGLLGEVVTFESHFDRFRPEVRQRWRETAGPGGGLWYDLGPHLVDQVIELFGVPDSIFADLGMQRQDATAVDYCHVLLRYGKRRVILHASAMVGAVGPRFVVHGTLGSYVKTGMDKQEDSLKSGATPLTQEWGLDPTKGELTTWKDGVATTSEVITARGRYQDYYSAIRQAILKQAPNPVPAAEALTVMRVLEAATKSAEAKRELSVNMTAVH